MWQIRMNEMLGVWLALAPLVSLDIPSVRMNNFIVGILVAFESGYAPVKKNWEWGVGLAAGLWVTLSTFFPVFLKGDGYFWSNVISGVLIFTSGWFALAGLPVEKHA